MNKAYKKLSRKLLSLTIITVILYIITSIASIMDIINQGNTTSFPWWSGLIMCTIYFIPVIIIEVTSYLLVTRKSNQKN